MQLKRFIHDDDAVSPVIGVILMVAITVILAAVIATFVLGLGEQISDTGPTASFDFEYTSTGSGTGDLTITHTQGQEIDASNLYVRGSNGYGSWASNIGTGTTYTAGDMIGAGDSVTVGVSSSDTVRVVWESSNSPQSSTLEVWEGSG